MNEMSAAMQLKSQQVQFSGGGTIYSYTVVQSPAEEFEFQAPYYLAMIQLDEGPRIVAQLTDVDDEIAIGDRVEMVTRKLFTDGDKGVIVYGYKFRKHVE